MASEKQIATNPEKYKEEVVEDILVGKRLKDLEERMSVEENKERQRRFVDRYTRQRVDTLERGAIKMRREQDTQKENVNKLELRTNDFVDSVGYECKKYDRLREKMSRMEQRSNSLDELFVSDREKQKMILQRVQSLEEDVDSKNVRYT